MDRISVTRHVEFEAAHLLYGYEGLCGNLHGHSYALEVTISCPEYDRMSNKFNFVVDFSVLNKILKDYVPDHSFITNMSNGPETTEGKIRDVLEQVNMRIFKMENSPSAENMTKKFAKDIQKLLESNFPGLECTVDEIKLWETTNSHATWRRG